MVATTDIYVTYKTLKVLRDIMNLETSPGTYTSPKLIVNAIQKGNAVIKVTIPLNALDVVNDEVLIVDLSILHNIALLNRH